MFTTKKQVDQHVRTSVAKLRNENEKRLRGFVIAKLYMKIGEYASAQHYVSGYLSANEAAPQAHRLLGDCLCKLKHPEKALSSYQRSFQLDNKQTDLLIDACNLILSEDLDCAKSNAKFWCEAAANSRIQHEAVFNVKFKMLAGDENKDTKQVEEMIVKEINNRPSEVSPRLQLVNYYIAKNRTEDAFKFISDVMNRNPSQFLSSLDWYAAVHKALNQYRQATDVVLSKNWDYWVLCISAVDRQLSLVLAQAHNVTSQQSAHLLHCQTLLFEMDQMLFAAGNISFPVRTELAAQMVNHFQGQFLLHAASFLYKRERTLNNNQWWATINKTLPLLFTAFRLGIASTEDAWLKQANESVRELVRLWQRQGAFRCSQAGRTLLSCIQTNSEDGALPSVAPFKTAEELTDAARKQSSSSHWTTSLFRHLFTNDDHFSKASTSFMVTSNLLADPTYELPTVLRLQMYERIAESLQSDSLPQLVYLYLHTDKLAECDFNVFPGLELTASNIFNCSAATLNKLDIESFLVAAVMQTQSRLEKDAKVSDGPRPKTLPFANMDRLMCSEEQLRWWQAAYNSTHGIGTDETLNVREVLQDGIEAVRCVGSPKMDLMIALLTGDVLKQKTENNLAIDLTTKKAYEDRVENLFMCALHLYKNQSTATVANKRRLFQYSSSNSNNPAGTEECEALLEGAIAFLAEQHFRNGDYEGCIDILTDIQLPYATYYIAEAYKKMDETNRSSRTPTRSGSYQNKVKQFLGQTQKLLASASKRSHSLRTVVSNELKKLQFSDMNNSVLSVDEDSLNLSLSHIPNTMMNRSASNSGSSLVRDQVSALTALVTQLTIQNTMLQTEMSDIKKMLQQKKEEPATPPNLSESMFARLDEQQRMSSAYHPFPHYADYGRYSVGGFPPMGAPYQGMAPFQSPSQYPPHMRGPAGMYGHPHDVNAMALAQANAGLLPTFDPITGTVSVSPMPGGGGVPQQAQTKPPGYYQPPPPAVAASQAPANVAPHSHQQSLLASQLQQPPLASSSTVDQVFVGNNILKTWNSTYNNEPVEKTAPANVVITSSDPVPMHNTVTAQTLLSVTIPPQHIKNFGQAPKVNDHFPTVISGSFNNLSSTLSHTATNISGDETATEEDYYEHGEEYHVHEEEEEEEQQTQTAVEPLPKPDKISFGIAAQPEIGGKPSPFSSFSFGGGAASTTTASPEKPFSSLFGNIPKPTTNATPEKPFGSLFGNVAKPPQSLFGFSSTPTGTPKSTSGSAEQGATVTGASPGGKANNDDTEDDYVPTAQFKPVIELPKLVEVKTGEEDEDVAFEHRAKLLRFDPTTKEWKERGLGNIRIMVLKTDASQVRLLMRREQVLKLACNQRVTKDQVFNKMPNSETALSWYAQDFAENELKTELFAIRFKTSDICQAFHAAIRAAQANMRADEAKPAAPPVKTATATTEKKGFGDMFKKQSGSWECNGCLIVNKSEALYCVACDSPKDDTVPKKETKAQGLDLSGVKPGQFSFGFGVKPTAPSVDVPQNLTTTTATAVKKEEVKTTAPAVNPSKGFGDAFKPKAGSWECSACYITNKGDAATCISCATPKDGSSAVPAASGLNFGATAAVGGGGGFNFGTAKSTISFGVPQAQGTASPANSFANLFSSPNPAAPSVGGLFGQSTATPANGPSFGLDSKQTFDFVFKPKSPGKTKSPQKLANGGGGGGAEEEAGSDEEDIEEENTAYFTPVIPLPDKVEARTGEEEEEVLYSHRAKLYRYTDGEWKERGLGDVKILKHSGTGKLRVVMRREQVLKICLNHVLDENVEYLVKDNKSWHFVANDFSEGVLELLQFSLRFKSPEVATEFKEAVDNALSVAAGGGENGATDDTLPALELTTEDGEANAEEIQLIKDLQLPAGFFDYNAAEKCAGCRGCEDDGFVFATGTVNETKEEKDELPLQMPKLPAPVTKPGDLAKSIFGSFSQSLVASPNTSNTLFGSANMFSGSPTKPTAFGGVSTFGQQTGATGLFSGMNNSFGTPSTPTGGSLFGSSAFGSVPAPTSTGSIFGSAKSTIVEETAPTSIFGQKSAFGSSAVPSATTTTSTFGSFNFGTAAQSLSFDKLKDSGNVEAAAEKPVAAESAATEPATVFKMDSNFSFASLAQQEPGSVFDAKPEVAAGGGFFGLSNTNDFKHFNNPAGQSNGNGEGEEEGGEDATYDPHFEPIIALPEEISVSTGEEEETKLFGERGRLYRFDSTNKEWKERGVGEFKVLHHPGKGTYRFIMRREQIFKLVLNHAISADFEFKPLDKSGKAFCWATMNHAESPGQLEQLAVRFKNTDIASKCEEAVKNCISNMQD